MIMLLLAASLWLIAAGLLFVAWKRGDGTLSAGLKRTWIDARFMVPRIALGVIGAGFMAKLLPTETIAALLGPESGVHGVFIASLSGMLTPGGPVVGFSVGIAALKAGAGMPAIIAYVTAWSLISLNRVIVWERVLMPADVVWKRVALSLPLAPLAGLMTLWFWPG